MVPREHEKLAGLVRHAGPQFRINGFSLGKRDDKVIEMRADGLEGGGTAAQSSSASMSKSSVSSARTSCWVRSLP